MTLGLSWTFLSFFNVERYYCMRYEGTQHGNGKRHRWTRYRSDNEDNQPNAPVPACQDLRRFRTVERLVDKMPTERGILGTSLFLIGQVMKQLKIITHDIKHPVL